MPSFFLTPSSIGYLAQGIMALAISVYLATRRRSDARAERQVQQLLTAMYGALTLFVLIQLLDSALDQPARLIFAYAQNTAVALLLLLAVQFAYRFPVAWPTRREPQLALLTTGVYLLFEAGLALQRYLLLAQGIVRFRPELADLPLLVGFLWLLAIAVRRAVRLLRVELAATPGVAGRLRLRNPASRAAVAYVLLYSVPLWLSAINLLNSYGWISANINDLLIALGVLGGIFFHALIYFNVGPQQTPLAVRLAGVALFTLLVVFGVLGWALSPALVAGYRSKPQLPAARALRFSVTAQGGYLVETRPLPVPRALGSRVAENQLQALPFAFPFFGSSYRSVVLYEDGIISFGRPSALLNLRLRYGTSPAIAPLFMDLDAPPEGGIFVEGDAEHYRISWHQLYSRYDPTRRYSFQLELFPDGAFELIYDATPAETIFSPADDAQMIRFTGVLPGDGTQPSLVDLLRAPPFQTPAGKGIVASYYLAFRAELHRLLLPLAQVLISGSALLLFGIPLFMYLTVSRPLQALLAGVQQLERGQPAPLVVVAQADELGALASAFNALNRSLQHAETDLQRYREHLEELVAQRTGELDEARVQAEAASRAKSTFLTTMSHELRTPLTAIIGLSETLARPPQITPDQRQDLQTIGQSGAYLLSLINNVLDMARLETGRVVLYPEQFELLQLLNDAQALVHARAQRKGLALRCEADPRLPPMLYGDALKLRQVLINLLGNAVKFTERGHVLLGVERQEDAHSVWSDRAGDAIIVRFQVSDSGMGIAPQALAQIFEPFAQSGGHSVAREGTGLGLSISQELVRLLGGELLVTSEPAAGSCFSFTLRLEIGAALRRTSIGPAIPASSERGSHRAMLAAQLHSCPAAWQAALSQAVRLGDFVEAEQLVATLREQAPELAAYLADLIAQYDQAALLAFLTHT